VEYTELYDRAQDPLELRDVSKDPAYAGTLAELTQELARLRTELKVPDPIPVEAYGNSFKRFLPLKPAKPRP
jgi:hypothetical protein